MKPISLGNYHFMPSPLAFLSLLILLPILLKLGFWQLTRYHHKNAYIHAYQQQTTSTPKNLEDTPNPMPFQSVTLVGTFDNTHQLLLDNRYDEGQAGFHVFTPFYDDPTQQIILINRGFVPRNPERYDLPQILPVEGQQTIQVRIDYPSKNPFALGAQSEEISSELMILQSIQFDQLKPLFTNHLASFVGLLEYPREAAYQTNWSPKNRLTPETHLGYAVQWFALAITLSLLTFAKQIKKRSPV